MRVWWVGFAGSPYFFVVLLGALFEVLVVDFGVFWNHALLGVKVW